ncbi:hypothetical protein HQ584_10945 [Patescibacteria group bacterium]|nr:hypothetical protein [Patescibacteria group bacterium]
MQSSRIKDNNLARGADLLLKEVKNKLVDKTVKRNAYERLYTPIFISLVPLEQERQSS